MVLGSDLRRANGRRGRGPRARGRGVALAAALSLFLAPALAACSDDSGGETAPPSPSVEQTASEPAEESPSASGPADAAAAEKEIKENWRKFFDPRTSTKEKQAVLENGERMGPVLAAFSGDKRGGQVQAEVEKVEFTSPTEANVTYTLLLEGATALPDASGTAVEQDGTWKVSVKTLCGLVTLSGNASPVPGC
ncbi:hypothetical protein PV416_22165 [Streptomyces ipomoeae]|uniref:hypothetical protein n=1 Tax=Streptomyces ipomoeae TaxID=103232 RepID=UPI0018F8A884|nr:hypothetical protein [Streptomyces ipomoeae]MDX2696209.1 hypothetical protein [Streptomyces ipomoeae]MDX2823735.1 hypothetical protein [Streptomyces ipomoeae]MDX2839979.1 hypothetical protein [Streptomyces ipomoeae]MDX2876303.1 hypothetical protein [Streptomyces ipomoeae]